MVVSASRPGQPAPLDVLSRPIPLEASSTFLPVDRRYQLAKRILDVSFTLLALPVIVVVGALAAFFIRLDSKGSVLFRQRRVGQHGVEFEMLKLRSMQSFCDDGIHRTATVLYLSGQPLSTNAKNERVYKLDHDPRVTRVGRIIRKTGIDELPQFWNVLMGHMTLVGPRPPLAYEVEHYDEHSRLRLSGKPGLTGLWQVYGRSRVTFQEMVEMDISYLQRQSIWLDLKLILLTVVVMLRGRGGA